MTQVMGAGWRGKGREDLDKKWVVPPRYVEVWSGENRR